MMILLNLAVWILGAELLFPNRQIKTLDDLPQLLSTVLGEPGRLLFYAGIFAFLAGGRPAAIYGAFNSGKSIVQFLTMH